MGFAVNPWIYKIPLASYCSESNWSGLLSFSLAVSLAEIHGDPQTNPKVMLRPEGDGEGGSVVKTCRKGCSLQTITVAVVHWPVIYLAGYCRPYDLSVGMYFLFLKKLLFYIRVYLINNVMMVSGKQQRDSAIHIHESIFPNYPPIPGATSHWVAPMLYSRSLLIHDKCCSVYVSITKLLTIPSPHVKAYIITHTLPGEGTEMCFVLLWPLISEALECCCCQYMHAAHQHSCCFPKPVKGR